MKAEVTINELRVGNLVHLIANGHENEPDLVKWIVDDFEFYENRMKDIQPIPLTEEWLLKFEKIDWVLKDDKGFYFLFNNKKVRLKFVHTVQNVYFYIEQKELLCANT